MQCKLINSYIKQISNKNSHLFLRRTLHSLIHYVSLCLVCRLTRSIASGAVLCVLD